MWKDRVRWFALILCAVMATVVLGAAVPYGTVKAAAKTGTVTVDKLNVRTGAGTSYSKQTSDGQEVYLIKGQTVTILSEKTEGWYEVELTFNKKKVKGYISAEFVKVGESKDTDSKDDGSKDTGDTSKGDTAVSSIRLPAKVDVSSLRVRSGAGTSYAQLTTVKKEPIYLFQDAKVTVLKDKLTKQGEKWYYISFTYNNKNKKGWVLGDYVKLTYKKPANAQINSASKVKVYQKAKENAAYLTNNKKTVTLSNKSYVLLYAESTVGTEKWFKVKFKQGSKWLVGYVPAGYLLFCLPEQKEEPDKPDTEKPDPDKPDTEKPDPEKPEEPETPPTDPVTDDAIDIIPPDDGKFETQTGKVLDNKVTVYSQASLSSPLLTDPATGKIFELAEGQEVTVFKKEEAEGITWYFISFGMTNSLGGGYVISEDIELSDSGSSGTGQTGKPLTEEEFEASMTKQGFPESYKPSLRALHSKYPNWQFTAVQTGLEWQTALDKESAVGVNLITNSRNVAWKSMEKSAYNWLNDKFIAYDGSTWVTASREAVAYYMDPRNFLTEKSIFQFEQLSYRSDYQNTKGIENILSGTPMANQSVTYKDESGAQKTSKYSTIFLAAAKYSGVSPYHLASRVKQEVITGASSFSSSASGTMSGFEGLYNFYNIGATHSTVAGGAIVNALNFAMSGNPNKKYDSTTSYNDYIMIPWTDQYRAIIGGAAFIGNDYIKRGQDTIYLQKFNMTSTSTYSHQYMANVEVGESEAAKTFAAYKSMIDESIIFSIPVYLNMPETACAAPADAKNPNNWLKSLAVDGYTLTPTFDPAKEQNYSLIVDKAVASVTLTGETASIKASASGLGKVELKDGTTTASVTVTAENGDTRVYKIKIVKK